MKRILSFFLIALLVFQMPFASLAADKPVAESQDLTALQKEIEAKYSIKITYSKDSGGNPSITASTLTTLDMALENVTPGLVKQVSEYYREKNGQRLTYSFVRKSTSFSGMVQLGAFYKQKSLIELYIPSSSKDVLLSGENPTTILHEFGHALHFMCAAKYGAEKMKREWIAFNGGSAYKESYMQNQKSPDNKRYISAYAATMYEEDVAETFAAVFVRAQSGQGFKNHLTTKDGANTALGSKVAYLEKMLKTHLKDTDAAIANYRRIHETRISVKYQGMIFSGDYMMFAGYPQPRYLLNSILSDLGQKKEQAVWLRALGGWYVKTQSGAELIVFPGGTWTKVDRNFEAPAAA